MSADIIISTFGQAERLPETITSICQNTMSDWTLWVLDQNPGDHVQRCVLRHAQQDSRIRYQRVPLAGLSATRNYGATLGQAPFLLFINDDCVADPNWIGELCAALADPNIWVAFGRVLPGARPDEPRQSIVLATKDSTRPEIYQHDRFNLGFGHGHNMGARRQHFLSLGGFDELLGAGARFRSWDDLDIGYRTMRRGGQIRYHPDALVYHCHWQDWGGVRASYRGYAVGLGATVAKYIRGGDIAALSLLLGWIGYHGVRKAMAKTIKHRQPRQLLVSFDQFIYPWSGLSQGLRTGLDRHRLIYKSRFS